MRLMKRTLASPLATPCCAAPAPQDLTSGCGCGCDGAPMPAQPRRNPASLGQWLRVGLPVLAAGILVYGFLEALARAFTVRILGLDPGAPLGSAVTFFAAEAPKVLGLLAAITFGVGFLQSFLRPEKIRDHLAHRSGAVGNLLASLFGIATPFCSCSAVPLFIGFLRVGVPLGVTFSYLVAAPMVNEVALALLLAMFGVRIAALYAATGLAVAFGSGLVLGWLHLEREVEPWVQAAASTAETAGPEPRLSLEQRLEQARRGTAEIVAKVWPYILAGLAVGAFIHGAVPEALLARFMGRGSWWTVPLAVLIGVPLYASTAVILPIVQSLLAKGAALGTVLAFLMAVTALSLPEIIILRRVLKPRLIALFLAVVTVGILAVGYLFNFLL